MQGIITILRAAHCRSTHHYFAIDALEHLQTAQSRRLASILLKYHDEYLEGAKAPDNSFKDFQNHVVHVRQKNWGGAPMLCQEWMGKARQFLDEANWKKAAYACGVLSHYFTDPIMPLHTAQSSRETAVHRPMEWSIFQSYDTIYRQAKSNGINCEFKLATDTQWIAKAVIAAASVANRHYDQLIAGYDLNRGNANPREGLSAEAIEVLAELFSLAIHGLSAVLTRLADETTAQLPQLSLTMTSLLATVDMPLAWIMRKISDSKERTSVAAIYREYQKTGTLKRNLPAEIAVVAQSLETQPDLCMRFDATDTTSIQSNSSLSNSDSSQESDVSQKSERPSRKLAQVTLPDEQNQQKIVCDSVDAKLLTADNVSKLTEPNQATESGQFVTLSQARLRIHSPERGDEIEGSKVNSERSKAVSHSLRNNSSSTIGHDSKLEEKPRESGLRIAPSTILPTSDEPASNVHYGSPLIDAPSIGPKTAKRFESIGIRTIRQLVSTSAEEIVQGLGTRWITEDLVHDWQDQARLVCEVPALSGYRAQLLVAIGCRTSWQLRTSNANNLFTQVAQFCETSEGQQILRSARIPTADDVVRWIDSAKQFARREVAA